ncbi:hypothetical protein BCF74_11372 [Knoellia remsis]|uniref:Uncharacterized protein n=1 Tax=Knoellia remsis TaxID=407159 RepID=A0A2T0UJW6_9MICO|nr:hypothetical protein [Knoellia remsis]PRY58148.1 hypothetical protein BCF74_11372 [Knoellia remsis]
MSQRSIKVSPDQVSAARALIVLRGGPDKVDPVIARLATAAKSSAPTSRPAVP